MGVLFFGSARAVFGERAVSHESLGHLTTESRNPASERLDCLSAQEIVRLMNAEDARVTGAVATQLDAIAQAVETIAERLRAGGRLVYLGAGTSGRLGALDAAECPPTFNSPLGQVVGLIAGGPAALTHSVEGAEDHPEAAVADLQAIGLGPRDVVVGIATSGRTPYVVGGLAYARSVGAYTIGLSCNREAVIAGECDLRITPVVGPEVLSGSTRLKAGTATKMVLNMLSTGAMVRLGKTYGNLMVDLRATNSKLRERSRRIVMTLTGCLPAEAERLLAQADGEVKTAVVMAHCGVPASQARQWLEEAGGHLRRVLEAHPKAEPHANPRRPLVLGVDGGGSKTVAWLAETDCLAAPSAEALRRKNAGPPHVVGRGAAGASNFQTVGAQVALENLAQAVEAAFRDAGQAPRPVDCAVLALAGCDRQEIRRAIEEWASQRQLAGTVRVVHDAASVLAAGTPDGWGVALIAGTGSFAFAQTPDGSGERAGGWGFLLGDEGGGYWIAMAGLRAAARAAEGRGPHTSLLAAFLKHFGLTDPLELIAAVHRLADDRAALAGLAQYVLAATDHDPVAQGIIQQAAEELAALVACAVRRTGLDSPFPLAFAGGLLVHHSGLQQRVVQCLECQGLRGQPVAVVPDPVAGAVLLAAREASRQ